MSTISLGGGVGKKGKESSMRQHVDENLCDGTITSSSLPLLLDVYIQSDTDLPGWQITCGQ